MRTLVEQTEMEIRKWLAAHQLLWDGNSESRRGKVGVHILMGGEDAGEWDIHPEENAILVGTQDMLLSRALNRGYGMSRYRWPMHFALVNNDCLWVMDETQLMGVGVETSAQLDGFRGGAMQAVGPSATWWMSATLNRSRLDTVDHRMTAGGWPTVSLSDIEKSSGRPHKLVTARRPLAAAPIVLDSTTKASYAKEMAGLIRDKHQVGTLTLVIVNRVERARQIYEALTRGKKALYDADRVALIHSRYRSIDRERHTQLLLGDKDGPSDRLVIATQAVEAGVDVSARLLITELAPWSSLVQRIGRCNRRAEIPDAQLLWVDVQPRDAKDELSLPYSETELLDAREALSRVNNASPTDLEGIEVQEKTVIRPVVRRRDVVDLFDTTPDICGQDLDISRYIRDSEDTDVQFFWREIGEGEGPGEKEPQPTWQELCPVSIRDARKFLKAEKVRGWRWNALERKWERAKSARPGAVYLVAANSGGYEDACGWTGVAKRGQLTTHRPSEENADSHDDNNGTFIGQWLELDRHIQQVVDETLRVTSALSLPAEESKALGAAALWHDIGKAHPEFQAMLTRGDSQRRGTIWAKSDNHNGKCARPGFRHELASALAWLLSSPSDAPSRDLVAYLIATHHGKVRLSIRSLPDEKGNPEAPEALFARGIWQGDRLPALTCGGVSMPEIQLDLSFMQMGEGVHGPSWLARTVGLRDRLGVFRLAYLETLLRSADARASRKPTT